VPSLPGCIANGKDVGEALSMGWEAIDWKQQLYCKFNPVEFFMKNYKIIVEKHADGYVAYPIGIKSVIVGEGDTYEEALQDVKSAIAFHRETFGEPELEDDLPVIEAFVAETLV